MPSVAFCDIYEDGSDWEKKFNGTVNSLQNSINNGMPTFTSAINCAQRNSNFQKQVINNQFRNPNMVQSGFGISGNNSIVPYDQYKGQFVQYQQTEPQQQYRQQPSQQSQQYQQPQSQQQLYDEDIEDSHRKYKKNRMIKKQKHYNFNYDTDSDSDSDLDENYINEKKTNDFINKLYKVFQKKEIKHQPNLMGINQGMKREYTPIEYFGPISNNIDYNDKELIGLYILFLILLILFIGQLGELIRIIYKIV